VRALEKADSRIVRQGKHIVMSNGQRILTIPRDNPVNAITMGGIARDAGLSPASAPAVTDTPSNGLRGLPLPQFANP
jgi:hypothetical protein